MAFDNLETKVKSITGAGYASQGFRSVSSRQVVMYDVKAHDDGQQPPLEPSFITDTGLLEIAFQQYGYKFPRAGESLFEWRDNWADDSADQISVIPWMRCTLVQPERDRQERLLWRTRAEYATDPRFDTKQQDLELVPLATAPSGAGGYGRLLETVWDLDEQVEWEDVDGDNLLLPTGTYYSEPFYRQYARKTYRQTQFEVFGGSAVEDAVQQRLYTLCSVSRFGDTPDKGTGPTWNSPPRWKVTNIEYQPVNIPYSNGSTIAYADSGYMMQYRLERNASPGGWLDRRGLTDNYVLTTANDVTTRDAYRPIPDASTIMTAILNPDGTAKANQSDPLSFKDHQMQPLDDWSWLE